MPRHPLLLALATLAASAALAQTPPAFSSLTPATGSAAYGTVQTFTFAFIGEPNIDSLQIGLGGVVNVNTCMMTVQRSAGTVNLWSDDGATFTTGPLGLDGVLQNSRCSVNLGASFGSGSGAVYTL